MTGSDWSLMPRWMSRCPFKNESVPTPEETESRHSPQVVVVVVVEDITSEAAKMVEKFIGTWKMISSENFDDYMKAIGRRECFC